MEAELEEITTRALPISGGFAYGNKVRDSG